MASDLDQYREEMEVQKRASKELSNNVDWNPHIKLPPGIELLKIPTPGVRNLNFFRYPKTIPGGIFTGMKFAAFREYATHQVGIQGVKVLCPYETYGKPCTLCAKKAAAFRDSSLSKDEKKEAARPYFTSKRRMYVVADADGDPQKLWILDIADNCLPDVLDTKIEMLKDAMLGWNSAQHGKTLAIMFNEESAGGSRRSYRKAANIELLPRIGEYKPEIVKRIPDLDSILVPLTDAEIVKMFNEGETPDDVDTKDEYASGTVKISSEQKELDEWAAGETGGDETPSDEPEATVEPEAAPFDDEPEAAAEPVQEKAVTKKTTAAPAKTETKASTKAAPKKETKAESKADDPGWD